MPLKKEAVTAVVAEASQKMSDPNYAAVMVGGFVQVQGALTQYISAHEAELGGADAVTRALRWWCWSSRRCCWAAGALRSALK